MIIIFPILFFIKTKNIIVIIIKIQENCKRVKMVSLMHHISVIKLFKSNT